MRRSSAYFLFIYITVASFASAVRAAGEQSVISSAITTFNQRQASEEQLRKAAEMGDKEAQFYFAETLKLISGYITPEAHFWYEKSARQGDIYSMYRLSRQDHDICGIMHNCTASSTPPKEWAASLLKIAKERANRGDGEGMEMMYTITGDLSWLVKSAKAGYPSAQCWLAVIYEDGHGWFFWPGERQKEMERLYKASAEGGYPDCINRYAATLLVSGDVDAARKWLLKGVDMGYANAVGSYAYSLEHGKYYCSEKDLQLAYAINLVLSEIGGGSRDAANYSLEIIEPQLTSAQIAAAIQEAKIWKATHPPISYYPPKLEILY